MQGMLRSLADLALVGLRPEQLIRTAHYLERAAERQFHERRYLPSLLVNSSKRWVGEGEDLVCELETRLADSGWWRIVLAPAGLADEPWNRWALITVYPLDR
jgi:hypothetical protein